METNDSVQNSSKLDKTQVLSLFLTILFATLAAILIIFDVGNKKEDKKEDEIVDGLFAKTTYYYEKVNSDKEGPMPAYYVFEKDGKYISISVSPNPSGEAGTYKIDGEEITFSRKYYFSTPNGELSAFDPSETSNGHVNLGTYKDGVINIYGNKLEKTSKSKFEKDIEKTYKYEDIEEAYLSSKKDEPTNPVDGNELTSEESTALISLIKKYNLLDLRNSTSKVTFDNVVTNDMLYAMFYYVVDQDDSFSKHWEDETSYTFKKNVADEYFKNVFGFTPKTYNDLVCNVDDEVLVYFDKNTGTFTYNDEHPGHGGELSGFIDYKIVDSKKDGETYTIDALFLRGNIADGYYVNDDEFNMAFTDVDEEEELSLYKKEFKKIDPSKYTKYSFEFKKDNNDFILVSIAPKK